jgi:N-methylhydantoinase B
MSAMDESTKVNPITLTVVWGGLRGLCTDVGLALQRTAYSAVVRDAGDCAAAIFDRQGRNVAQGVFSPGHLGPMTFIVERMLEKVPVESLAPGDALITNDIYIGAGQLPDTFLVSPVFCDGDLIGFVASSVHLMDVGGASPGSQAVVGIYDNFQEGLRIPIIKCYEAGEPVDSVIEMIANNVRFPDKVLGDLRAMVSANHFGGQHLTTFFGRYGIATMNDCYAEILKNSEDRTRKAITEIPDGMYSNELDLDDYGPGTPPIHLAVDITVRGSEVIVDWSRSDGEVPAGLNSAVAYSYAYSSFTLKCLLAPDVPMNVGCTRPIKMMAPEGNFMNPRPPAPGGGRSITIHRHFETIMGAMAEVLPDRAMGACSQWCNVLVGGERQDGTPYLFWDILMGGFAARSTKDGPEALCSVMNARNIPVEVSETDSPVRIERIEFVQDTSGAGRYRGASAVRKDVRFLGRRNLATPVGDRHVFAPHGIQGGLEGALGLIVRDPDGKAEKLHSKGVQLVEPGVVIRFQVSGAGGYGPPLERDAAAVLRDVRDGYVSREAAARDYGVVVTQEDDVDVAATTVLRSDSRKIEKETTGGISDAR